MVWDISSTIEETNVTISRPKDSLLTDVNKLETTEATES